MGPADSAASMKDLELLYAYLDKHTGKLEEMKRDVGKAMENGDEAAMLAALGGVTRRVRSIEKGKLSKAAVEKFREKLFRDEAEKARKRISMKRPKSGAFGLDQNTTIFLYAAVAVLVALIALLLSRRKRGAGGLGSAVAVEWVEGIQRVSEEIFFNQRLNGHP